MDWRAYWEDYPRRFGELDFCKQVGRTANGGVPTGEAELARVVDQMSVGLGLEADDVLLDLCCGNGLLTRAMAARCRAAVGVDFSEPMIELAREHHSTSKVRYVQGSALELETLDLGEQRFTKIAMFESLQYFEPSQLPALLAGIGVCSADQLVAYFSGVLDRDRIWDFFDTPERRASYEAQKREGTEIMGHWWSRAEIEEAAGAAAMAVRFIAQDPGLNTAHYRFDVRLERV